MTSSNIILYITEDGKAKVELRTINETVWLNQEQIAKLFDRERSVITKHISNIFLENELDEKSNVQNMHIPNSDKPVKLYSLDLILAVGYRVRSDRGVQFRRWASTVLKEYLSKGFAMDDKRLKDPRYDYFDELLARIRDIRASEARFYQKVRDILSLSIDYDSNSEKVQAFYAKIQNKMLYAVTNHTAAELITHRADENLPNMGLTSWKGSRVRKVDVATGKNYLNEKEVSDLNLIVGIFLDTAEFRANRGETINLVEWELILDEFIKSNKLPVLKDAGTVSAQEAEELAFKKYDIFDENRKKSEKELSEKIDELEELKTIADTAKKLLKNPKK